MKKIIKFPAYLYHKEYADPKRVDNQDQATELMNKGWVHRRLWKEYPKWVNGVLCNDRSTEDLLIKNQVEKPVVVKDHIIKSPTGAMPDKKIQVQTPGDGLEKMEFEIVDPDGEVIPDLQFSTWKEAQSTQSELNKNVPGHKARKMKDESTTSN